MIKAGTRVRIRGEAGDWTVHMAYNNTRGEQCYDLVREVSRGFFLHKVRTADLVLLDDTLGLREMLESQTRFVVGAEVSSGTAAEPQQEPPASAFCDVTSLKELDRTEPGAVFNVYAHPESSRYAVTISFSRADVMRLREMPGLQEAKYHADSPEARAIVRMLEELTRRREP